MFRVYRGYLRGLGEAPTLNPKAQESKAVPGEYEESSHANDEAPAIYLLVLKRESGGGTPK